MYSDKSLLMQNVTCTFYFCWKSCFFNAYAIGPLGWKLEYLQLNLYVGMSPIKTYLFTTTFQAILKHLYINLCIVSLITFSFIDNHVINLFQKTIVTWSNFKKNSSAASLTKKTGFRMKLRCGPNEPLKFHIFGICEKALRTKSCKKIHVLNLQNNFLQKPTKD